MHRKRLIVTATTEMTVSHPWRGRPDAEVRLLKAEISRQFERILAERGLTQAQAAALIGAEQPRVSDIVRGKLKDYTIDRLVKYLVALGYDIELVLHERPTGEKPELWARRQTSESVTDRQSIG